jgi:large subunit ribosomal protein L9
VAKLILTNEVTGLGEPGDVVEVKDGYARNFLLPRKLATPWTKGFEKQVADIRKARKAREIAGVDDAKATAMQLKAEAVPVSAKAGQAGRLFGAVTSTDIAAALAKKGVAVDKRKIEIEQPIKTTGSHAVSVRLHPEVVAKLSVNVVAA